jgi:hypothetical protein
MRNMFSRTERANASREMFGSPDAYVIPRDELTIAPRPSSLKHSAAAFALPPCAP